MRYVRNVWQRAKANVYGASTYRSKIVRFEVFTAVTMMNGVFWDVTPHGTTSQKIPFFRSKIVLNVLNSSM
jgi:hypothetical protein